MEEKLIPVRDFAELRTGMIVSLVCAAGCGRHRGLLVGFDEKPSKWLDGSVHCEETWNVEPAGDCCPSRRMCFGVEAITEGRVFRVDDGLQSSSKTPERKRKEARV